MNDEINTLPQGHVMDIESANAEFDRFADGMGLDLDAKSMNAEDLESLERVKSKVLKAMMKGAITIDNDCQLHFMPQRPGSGNEEIVFYEPTGATLMDMDKKKASQEMAKMNIAIAGMTQKNPGYISSLKLSDYNLVGAIATLFLG